MGRRILQVVLASLLVLGGNVVHAQARAKHVFIISIDGGKPAVLQAAKMLNLRRLEAEGASTWTAKTVLPSVTLTSHASMVTGVTPTKHKQIWDDWEPNKGYIKVPTIFQLAKAQHLSTAMIVGKKKLQHLAPEGSVDLFKIASDMDFGVAKFAVSYIKRVKPNLCFIHLPDVDGYGHKYGWGSAEQNEAATGTDKAIGSILQAIVDAGINSDSVIIISADHGGHKHIHGTKSPEDMNIPWIVWGKGVKHGYKIVNPVTTMDTAATALYVLGVPVPANWDGKPVKEAFK